MEVNSSSAEDINTYLLEVIDFDTSFAFLKWLEEIKNDCKYLTNDPSVSEDGNRKLYLKCTWSMEQDYNFEELVTSNFDTNCPARIDVTINDDDSVHAEYCSAHNHTLVPGDLSEYTPFKWKNEKLQIFEFADENEYLSWKRNTEIETKSRFIKIRGSNIAKNGDTKIYLKCHRSSTHWSKSMGITENTVTYNGRCSSRINVTVSYDGRHAVEFYPHHNHATTYEWKDSSIIFHKFLTEQEFWEWKEVIERETKAKYVQVGGKKKLKKCNGRKIYLQCHRSGRFNPEHSGINDTNRKKKFKSQGSCKLGQKCAARMNVLIKGDGQVSIEFYPDHQHAMDIEHLTLSKKERSELAEKLRNGATFDDIIDDVLSDATLDSFSRIHMLKRHDLHNIAKQFNIVLSSNQIKSSDTDDELYTQVLITEDTLLTEDDSDSKEETLFTKVDSDTYFDDSDI